MKLKYFNTITGKFFVEGKGFVSNCLHEATIYDIISFPWMVEAYKREIGSIRSENGLEWQECGCDYCGGQWEETYSTFLGEMP